jgi:hypothetical protein
VAAATDEGDENREGAGGWAWRRYLTWAMTLLVAAVVALGIYAIAHGETACPRHRSRTWHVGQRPERDRPKVCNPMR